MTLITNADQVLMLLRSHLERVQRSSNSRRTASGKAKTGPVQRLRQLAPTEEFAEADIARALIAGLLSEEFGPELAAEPRFHAMVEDVRQMLDRDETGRALLRRAIGELSLPDKI
jgi:hypothetical protein